jgi:hypothetical protein
MHFCVDITSFFIWLLWYKEYCAPIIYDGHRRNMLKRRLSIEVIIIGSLENVGP